MAQAPFDQDHVKIFRAISRGSYSFAVGLSGIVIACITSLPDACEHHKLMSTYSKMIIWGFLLSIICLITGIYAASEAEEAENKEETTWKEAFGGMLTLAYIRFFLIASFLTLCWTVLFSNIIITAAELPLNAAAALTFCEQPDKPDKSESK